MPILTIDFNTVPAARIAAALGKELNLVDETGVPRSATMAEYRAWVIDVTRRMVLGWEDRTERDKVPPPPSFTVI